MAEVEIDKLPTYIGIPAIQEDAMSGDGPFKASIEVQEQLGFPGEKVENWQQIAIEKIAETTSKYRSVQVFLDACVKCGACTDKCHYYLGTADPKNMPVARQDLFRSVYQTAGDISLLLENISRNWLEPRNLMTQCLMIGITTFINALSVVVAQFSALMALIRQKFQWRLGK